MKEKKWEGRVKEGKKRKARENERSERVSTPVKMGSKKKQIKVNKINIEKLPGGHQGKCKWTNSRGR